jgi:L-threonylcarbamoyladenylate synthase
VKPEITRSVERAATVLRAGGLVAIPTETVYGLAADATNPAAVSAVFARKGRPADHPLIVHCADAGSAWRCAGQVTETARRLAARFWPGPLTLVLQRAAWVSPQITAGQDSVALRVPAHPATLALLRTLGRPLVAPSANRFGRVSPSAAEHVVEEFADSTLLVLDGGPCPVGIESTIVDCRSEDAVRVLRPGVISQEELAAVLGAGRVRAREAGAAPPRVSGDLPAHYAPRARVVLIENGAVGAWLQEQAGPVPVTWLLSRSPPEFSLPPGITWHSPGEDLEEFARRLYALFRAADRAGCERIAVELPDEAGIGRALRDRLQRAAC